MPIPTIVPAEPVVQPEVIVPAKTYDKMWLAQCNIQSFNPGGEAAAHVELVKFNYNEQDGYTMAPNPSVVFSIPNLMERSAQDEELATIMYLLMNYVIKVGREQGVVAPAPESP